MNAAGFYRGAAVAAALALLASILVAALTPMLSAYLTFKIVVPILALAYTVYLFSRSRERVGRLTCLLLWLLLAASTWLLEPPLVLYVLAHVTAVWLLRSLYFYASLLPALLDLALCALSVATAFWAFGHSGSIFLSVWCLFLVQALFVAIPPSVARESRASPGTPADTGHFDRARRRAENAIRQLLAH